MADVKNNFEIVADNFEQEDDKAWINFIFSYLIIFYNSNRTNKEIKSKSEDKITDEIYNYLNNEKKFRRKMVVNSQPKTDNTQIEGYYDLKFQSNFWRENSIHFAIENKILEDKAESYKEYIYKPIADSSRKYDNGGMFRFLSNKYAKGQDFGGMIGFIKKGNIEEIQKNLKNKIRDLKIPNKNNFYGELIDDNLLKMKIQNFDNSLQTNHITKDGTKIHILHLLFNFDENK